MYIKAKEGRPTKDLPTVYWLKLVDQLLDGLYHKWEPWIESRRPDMKHVSDELHCTLLYDHDNSQTEYDACWQQCLQGKSFTLRTGDMIIGPQGVAVEAILDDNLLQWYKVENSVPHVSLMVAKYNRPMDLGPMVLASQKMTWVETDDECVFVSADRTYYKITTKSVNRTIAEKVAVDRLAPYIQAKLTKDQEELLKAVPDQLWTKHHTDVGFIKSVEPVQIILKPNARLPYQRQYPLSKAAFEGIKPTIEGLVQAGVLVETTSRCNTPIYPVRKPNSDKWRLVHDLRAVNAVVEGETPVVPDPHTLLSNIPFDAMFYSVIDLCSAFFSIPLDEQSKYL
uniref:Reverse transcriptase domain-containing protein n=1 Tax=Astyanax mexicanus TaxID=7994 RepID=A0A8B9JFM9_ASTMX